MQHLRKGKFNASHYFKLSAITAAMLVSAACSQSANSISAYNASNAETSTIPITYYTSKTPYTPNATPLDYSAAPQGFELINIQHVARHGSRGLSSPDSDDLVMQLWLQAQRENALTPLGLELGPAVAEMLAIHHNLGYGQLSGSGRTEHQEMAARIIARHAQALDNLEAPAEFAMIHSGRSRARDSGVAFQDGWLQIRPQDESKFLADIADQHTVYFHSAEGSEGYDDYKDGERLQALMAEYEANPRSEEAVRDILAQLFTAEFISKLDAETYQMIAHDDDEDQINNGYDAAMAIYDLFSIAVNLEEEGAPDFTRFIPEQTREWLAEIDDADSFYGRGPGFAGEDISYAAAENLVRDMLARAIRASEGDRSEFAAFRFTHAQALMPVATWLKLPNAWQVAEVDEPYSYENNPWRAAIIAPMSANIQWDIYQNDGQQTLVRMLWNEAESLFAPECVAAHGYFYELNELVRCYQLEELKQN